jgi:hypothetical protein
VPFSFLVFYVPEVVSTVVSRQIFWGMSFCGYGHFVVTVFLVSGAKSLF